MQQLWLLLIISSFFTTSGQDVKILQVDNKLTVTCSFYHDDGEALEIEWFKEEAPLESDDHIVLVTYEEKVSEHKAVNNQTELSVSKLKIEKALAEDIGYYDCRTTGTPELSKSFLVTSIFYKNLPLSTEVDEGDNFGLTCVAEGDHNLKPVVHWEKESVPIEKAVNSSKLTIYDNADGLSNASFNISDTDQSDRGHYTCIITYEPLLVYSTTTNVRVKDPLRALWPFIGIVIQAVLLALTIFMCEKMKTKEGDDDSDDDSNIAVTPAVASTSAVAT